MKNSLVIFLIFFNCNFLFGQEFKDVYSNAYSLYNAGKYKEAIPVAQTALELAKQKFSEKSFEIANSQDLLGRIYDNLDDYKLAIPFYQKPPKLLGYSPNRIPF